MYGHHISPDNLEVTSDQILFSLLLNLHLFLKNCVFMLVFSVDKLNFDLHFMLTVVECEKLHS
jgi:hypothetical protein